MVRSAAAGPSRSTAGTLDLNGFFRPSEQHFRVRDVSLGAKQARRRSKYAGRHLRRRNFRVPARWRSVTAFKCKEPAPSHRERSGWRERILVARRPGRLIPSASRLRDNRQRSLGVGDQKRFEQNRGTAPQSRRDQRWRRKRAAETLESEDQTITTTRKSGGLTSNQAPVLSGLAADPSNWS
jgi:hypothetical protein